MAMKRGDYAKMRGYKGDGAQGSSGPTARGPKHNRLRPPLSQAARVRPERTGAGTSCPGGKEKKQA